MYLDGLTNLRIVPAVLLALLVFGLHVAEAARPLPRGVQGVTIFKPEFASSGDEARLDDATGSFAVGILGKNKRGSRKKGLGAIVPSGRSSSPYDPEDWDLNELREQFFNFRISAEDLEGIKTQDVFLMLPAMSVLQPRPPKDRKALDNLIHSLDGFFQAWQGKNVNLYYAIADGKKNFMILTNKGAYVQDSRHGRPKTTFFTPARSQNEVVLAWLQAHRSFLGTAAPLWDQIMELEKNPPVWLPHPASFASRISNRNVWEETSS